MMPHSFSRGNAARQGVAALFFLFALPADAFTPGKAYLTDLFERAKTDYLAGRLDAALTKLDERDKAESPNANSLDLRGAIALEQGKLGPAESAFAEANKLEPALFSPRLHRADLLLRAKKYSEARELYGRLITETNVLISNERARYGAFVAALAGRDETSARQARANIKFPTETPAYYYAQAAAEFGRGDEKAARKWIATAREIFDRESLAWFARPLHDLGWIKEKPAPPF